MKITLTPLILSVSAFVVLTILKAFNVIPIALDWVYIWMFLWVPFVVYFISMTVIMIGVFALALFGYNITGNRLKRNR